MADFQLDRFKQGQPLQFRGLSGPMNAGVPWHWGDVPVMTMEKSDAAGYVLMQNGGVFRLAVKGEDDGGNAAVSYGDIVYLDAGVLNIDAVNGNGWGMALGEVASGATTYINVLCGA